MANVQCPQAPMASAGDQQPTSDGVGLSSEWRRGAMVVRVSGEVDASNVHHLTGLLRRSDGDARPLVLDLTRVDFFAAHCTRILFELAEERRHLHANWALVPGRVVARLLRVSDPEGLLPTADSADQALQNFSVSERPSLLLQLAS